MYVTFFQHKLVPGVQFSAQGGCHGDYRHSVTLAPHPNWQGFAQPLPGLQGLYEHVWLGAVTGHLWASRERWREHGTKGMTTPRVQRDVCECRWLIARVPQLDFVWCDENQP